MGRGNEFQYGYPEKGTPDGFQPFANRRSSQSTRNNATERIGRPENQLEKRKELRFLDGSPTDPHLTQESPLFAGVSRAKPFKRMAADQRFSVSSVY